MADDASETSDVLSPEQELEEELEDMFDTARVFVEQAVMSGSTMFDDSTKLRLYGLFKQATVGPCTTPRPYLWDVKGKAKWNAWHDLGGMHAEEAKIQYVECVRKAGADMERPSEGDASRKAWGPVFSRFADDEPAAAEEADKEEESGLLAAARAGDEAAARAALEAGGSGAVAEVDREGCTALHLAADSGAAGVVGALVAAGADVNARDAEGQTPLHYAAICEHREVCELLLQHGADASLQDEAGETPASVGPSTWTFWPAAAS